MIEPQAAAVEVLDGYPTDDEVEEIVMKHLEDFDADEATAHVEIVYKAPDWLDTCEQDQVNAHLRDAGRRSCVVVVYMSEGSLDD